MNSPELAIIIPAYKNQFFFQTLESLSVQSNKNFKVYIGNDNSPFEFETIISQFQNKLNISYVKFESNLGQISLTSHWERCIELSHEKWIWLFSDDDVIECDCVEKFYQRLNDSDKLYKFNTKVIDSDDNVVIDKFSQVNSYQNFISPTDFIKKRIKCNGFRSFAVEYIFSREIFNKIRFVNFPLAWASDDATWLLYSIDAKKINCIDAFVRWRYSGINITASNNVEISSIKVDSSIEYCIWLKNISSRHYLGITDNELLYWLSVQITSLCFRLGFSAFIKLTSRISTSYKIFALVRYFIFIKYCQAKVVIKNNLGLIKYLQ